MQCNLPKVCWLGHREQWMEDWQGWRVYVVTPLCEVSLLHCCLLHFLCSGQFSLTKLSSATISSLTSISWIYTPTNILHHHLSSPMIACHLFFLSVCPSSLLLHLFCSICCNVAGTTTKALWCNTIPTKSPHGITSLWEWLSHGILQQSYTRGQFSYCIWRGKNRWVWRTWHTYTTKLYKIGKCSTVSQAKPTWRQSYTASS